MEQVSVDDLLQSIGWSDGELARRCDVPIQTAQHWRKGKSRMPPPLLAWLQEMAAFHEGHPPPQKPPV